MNIIPGFVNPGDMREMKRIVYDLGIDLTMFPDTTDVLDSPLTKKYDMYPKGGTTVAQIKDSGNFEMTLSLGSYSSDGPGCAAGEVWGHLRPSGDPIGIKATDDFIMALKKVSERTYRPG